MVLVTIIMPTYNTGAYIIKAIESVVKQTFADWELIIIDDGSKDDTYKKVLKYINDKNLHKKIKLIKNPKNKGCYISMNIGLQKAKGKFITRLDADDIFYSNKLKLQVSILNKNKKLIGVRSFYIRNKNIRRNNSISMMYHKSIIKRIGYYDSVRFGADDEFTRRVMLVYGKKRVGLIKKVLYFARIRPGSLTRNKKTGIRSFLRTHYFNAFSNWHRRNILKKKKLFIKFPLKKRPFFVNKYMNH